jgi:Glyoxalase/Bleomycin resistance protein/Dioxygenase superfamily
MAETQAAEHGQEQASAVIDSGQAETPPAAATGPDYVPAPDHSASAQTEAPNVDAPSDEATADAGTPGPRAEAAEPRAESVFSPARPAETAAVDGTADHESAQQTVAEPGQEQEETGEPQSGQDATSLPGFAETAAADGTADHGSAQQTPGVAEPRQDQEEAGEPQRGQDATALPGFAETAAADGTADNGSAQQTPRVAEPRQDQEEAGEPQSSQDAEALPGAAAPGDVWPAVAAPVTGDIHHVELWVPNLDRAILSWGWLLTALGYRMFQDWPGGRSWRSGSAYIVVEQSPARTASRHDRCRPGLNHLAFHVTTRQEVDELTAEALLHGWKLMFTDLHPFAGGPQHYAAYLENVDGFEVELVTG